GRYADCNDNWRIQKFDSPDKERIAAAYLGLRRTAVGPRIAARAAQHSVGNESVLTGKTGDLHEFVKCPPGCIAREWDARSISSLAARSLRDKEHARISRAVPRAQHGGSFAHPGANAAGAGLSAKCCELSFFARL